MPKPSFAGRRRKTNLNLNDPSDQNVYESRFSQYLMLQTRVSSAFFSRPGIQIPGNPQMTFLNCVLKVNTRINCLFRQESAKNLAFWFSGLGKTPGMNRSSRYHFSRKRGTDRNFTTTFKCKELFSATSTSELRFRRFSIAMALFFASFFYASKRKKSGFTTCSYYRVFT